MRLTTPLVLLGIGCAADTVPQDHRAPCTERSWFADRDGDGFGNNADTTSACTLPDGYAIGAGDCDDEDDLVHPDASEFCDGRDDNCNGEVDEDAVDASPTYADEDGDGFGDGTRITLSCEVPSGHVIDDGDCDDTSADAFPGAPELCDEQDNDCDGVVPDDEQDLDGDGYIACEDDCEPTDPESHPGADEWCDAVDNDCNGTADDAPLDGFWLYPDVDGDDYGDTDSASLGCAETPGWILVDGDCDDLDPAVNPEGDEGVADGADQDCDGLEICWEDADEDGVGTPTAYLTPSLDCTALGVSSRSDDCNDADPLVFPGNPEIPYDGRDNDCAPETPDDDLDGDGYGHAVDCDDTDPNVHPQDGGPLFIEVGISAGLDAPQWDETVNPFECFPWLGMAAGAAIADVDNDGFLDVFIPRLQLPDRLYLNLGDGTFTDQAVARGISHTGTSASARWFDADADGDLDLFVVSAGQEDSRLYIQDVDGTFTEEAVSRSADTPRLNPLECSNIYGTAAADHDGDGDLDLHTNAWFLHNAPGIQRSFLLQNDGLGFFTDQTFASGLDLYSSAAFASAFIDYDDDGDLDVSVAADWGTSRLYESHGDGTFTDVSLQAQISAGNAMGSTWADYDRDGDLDWFTTAIYDPGMPCNPVVCDGNRLFANNGDGTFSDLTDAAGVRRGGWGWGAAFFDADNDGDLDLGQVDGPHAVAMSPVPPLLFVNDGHGVFTDQACEAGLGPTKEDRSLLPFDFDNDGDLDLLIITSSERPRLYENLHDGANAWIRVALFDPTTPGNQRAIGAKITVQAELGGELQRADVHANEGYGAQRPAEAHFGFGPHAGPLHWIEIRWPDGEVVDLFDVAARQVLTVDRSAL